MSFFKEIPQTGDVGFNKAQKEKNLEKLQAIYKKDSELVKGTFIDHETEGKMPLEFVFQKWSQDPVRIYKFEHNESYTVPRCVAEHINKNTRVKKNSALVDINGKPMLVKPRQRYTFAIGYFQDEEAM